MTKFNNYKTCLAIIAIELIINAICYQFLPDRLGVHFNISGEVDGTLPRLGFVFLMPLLSLGCILYEKYVKRVSVTKVIITCILLFFINAGLLIINL